MKYELIPKDVLDEVCEYIIKANNNFAIAYTKDQKNMKLLDDVSKAKLYLDRAYQTIQRNRAQCNVQPESRD